MNHFVPIERQKAAQAAGEFGIDDLPGALATPAAALRVGKTEKEDVVIVGDVQPKDVTTLEPGDGLVVIGKAESAWATSYYHRYGGKVTLEQLLSYARQYVGVHPTGELSVCLCGHAGRVPFLPLWVLRSEVTLVVQPNDLVIKFVNQVPEIEVYD